MRKGRWGNWYEYDLSHVKLYNCHPCIDTQEERKHNSQHEETDVAVYLHTEHSMLRAVWTTFVASNSPPRPTFNVHVYHIILCHNKSYYGMLCHVIKDRVIKGHIIAWQCIVIWIFVAKVGMILKYLYKLIKGEDGNLLHSKYKNVVTFTLWRMLSKLASILFHHTRSADSHDITHTASMKRICCDNVQRTAHL